MFLVKDGKGAARRGSGEGGSYTLSGDRLLLRHRYNVSGGATLPAWRQPSWCWSRPR